MLRARVITALILAPLVVSAIYLLPLWAYAVFFSLFAGAGAYEWGGLGGLVSTPARLGYLAIYIVLALVTWRHPEYWQAVLWAGGAFWLMAAVAVVAYPRGGRFSVNPAFTLPAGLVVAWAAWLALVVIRDQPGGATWVLWLLLLVWAADIGAYFAGHRFGRRKLAPVISPGKTWEGLLGGSAVSLVVALLVLLPMGVFSLFWAPVVALLIAVSVFGDLFESMLKRARGVKDSGALLPGHGGVLDRIDSMVAVLPVFALVLTV